MKQFENPVQVPGVPYLVCCSENVYDYHDLDSKEVNLAIGMVEGWMNSPGHRRNILNKETHAMGAAVVQNGSRRYGTQVFSPYTKGGIVTKGNIEVKIVETSKDLIVLSYTPKNMLKKFPAKVVRMNKGDKNAFSFEREEDTYLLTYQRTKNEKNLPMFRIKIKDPDYSHIFYPLCQFRLIEKEDNLGFEWKKW